MAVGELARSVCSQKQPFRFEGMTIGCGRAVASLTSWNSIRSSLTVRWRKQSGRREFFGAVVNQIFINAPVADVEFIRS
jgi:hypothetical protein